MWHLRAGPERSLSWSWLMQRLATWQLEQSQMRLPYCFRRLLSESGFACLVPHSSFGLMRPQVGAVIQWQLGQSSMRLSWGFLQDKPTLGSALWRGGANYFASPSPSSWRSLDGLHTALSWTVPALNQFTFVNGYSPMQIALGRQPDLPGLLSDERTEALQLQASEQDQMMRRSESRDHGNIKWKSAYWEWCDYRAPRWNLDVGDLAHVASKQADYGGKVIHVCHIRHIPRWNPHCKWTPGCRENLDSDSVQPELVPLPADDPEELTEVPAEDELPPVPEDAELDREGEQGTDVVPDHVPDPSYVPVPDEDFNARRRRVDQQETIWLRRPSALTHERPAGGVPPRAKKPRVYDGDAEIDVDLFAGDGAQSLENMKLPTGWHYDQSKNEFYLGETQDYWGYEDGTMSLLEVTRIRRKSFPFLSKSFRAPVVWRCRILEGRSMWMRRSRQSWAQGSGLARPSILSQRRLQRNMVIIMWATSRQSWTLTSPSEVVVMFGPVLQSSRRKRWRNPQTFERARWPWRIAWRSSRARKLNWLQSLRIRCGRLRCTLRRLIGAESMKARFVLKWTQDSAGNPRAKARPVLQGFSDPDLLSGELETSSPTLSRSSRQVLLSISTCCLWLLFVADVATAFLQGDPQKRILWAKIPRDACMLIGVPPGTLMRLVKPIYGQADAPREWFQVAPRRLCNIGYKPHPLDKCLFLLHDKEGKLVSAIGLHVDDMLGGGDEGSECYKAAKQRLREEFNFKRWTEEGDGKPLEFCGCSLVKTENGWTLQQSEYIHKVKPIKMKCNEERELSGKEVSLLRALLGALQWPATAPASVCCVEMSAMRQRRQWLRQTKLYGLQKPTVMQGWSSLHSESLVNWLWSRSAMRLGEWEAMHSLREATLCCWWIVKLFKDSLTNPMWSWIGVPTSFRKSVEAVWIQRHKDVLELWMPWGICCCSGRVA